jgi:histidinol phosphatase-like PHP family hydrolase
MIDPTYADFHIHTHLSPCGKPQATAQAMILRAQAKGLSAVGFADHCTPEPIAGCPFYDHQRPHLLSDLREEIAQQKHAAGMDILVGVEADYTLAGPSCITPEILAHADHVICASSHFHLAGAPQPARDGPRAQAKSMHHFAREALALPGVSVWAHPFDCSRMRPLSPILRAIREAELVELIDLANEHAVAIEINGGAAQRQEYRKATSTFFGLAREMDARFTITADAHHPDDMARLDIALDWTHALGIRDELLLTAQELRERHRRKSVCSASQGSGPH